MFRSLSTVVMLCAAGLACAHTSSSSEDRRCDDDTECPVGDRCSTGRCVSGDQLLAQQRPAAESAPVQQPTPEPEAAPEPSPSFMPPSAPPRATTKTYRGNVSFGQINYPVEWTVQMSTVDDPANNQLSASIRGVKEKLDAGEPMGPQRQKIVDELTGLAAQHRRRMLELGEFEASAVFSLLQLMAVWKHADPRKPPKNTGLVAVFPGSPDNGTLYCDKVVSAIDGGGPGVDPMLLQIKFECEGKELESFLFVEVVADKGGVDSSHTCVRIAEGVGGSYKVLADCLKSRKYPK